MLITNASIITWGEENRILPNHDLLIREGRIAEFAPHGELAYSGEEILDARGQYLMPGNICAHTHFYGAFSRGWAYPGEPATNFMQILERLWWRLDTALDAEAVRYSALVCLVDAIKYGTTTLFDHHASPSFIEGSLDLIHDAIVQSGLRASLCYEVTDRDGLDKADAGIAENSRFIGRVLAGQADPKVKAHFGLHASLTVSKETLDKALEANAGRAGFHSHAAEGIVDQKDSLQKYGKSVIERFAEAGVLGERSIMVHGVHADAYQTEILARSKTWLTHQPRSNMNNAVGAADVPRMLEQGVKVCLGNDGFSNAMWDEWKAAYFIQKHVKGDPRAMGGYDVVKLAIENNSALATQTWEGLPIGKIEKGAAADLILVDYHPITPLTAGNLPWHIIFGFRDGMVTSTIVDGRVLMKDRQLLTLDEAEIAAKAREHTERTWAKVGLVEE